MNRHIIMKRKEDPENDKNVDSQKLFPILCIFLYFDYERVLFRFLV